MPKEHPCAWGAGNSNILFLPSPGRRLRILNQAGGGGKYAPQGKLAIFAVILHSRQQKTYQWTLKT